jgi:hypothetical protein
VCWRHTTRPDGTRVWRMLAADMNVRTLGGARFPAPLGEGDFGKRWFILTDRSTGVGTLSDFKVGGARAVGETIVKTLRAAPCCVYRMVSLRIH